MTQQNIIEKKKISELNELEYAKLVVNIAEGLIDYPLVEISPDEAIVMAKGAVKSLLETKCQDYYHSDVPSAN